MDGRVQKWFYGLLKVIKIQKYGRGRVDEWREGAKAVLRIDYSN